MIYILNNIFIVFIILILTLNKLSKENVLRHTLITDLRVKIKDILNLDLSRTFMSFYESYLFVYDKSNTTPNDEKFIEFRTLYIAFFRQIVGNKQCSIYDDVFGGSKHFDYFLNNEFEKFFKQLFISKVTKQAIKD